MPGHGAGGAGRGGEAVCWLAEGPAEVGSSKLSVEAAGQSGVQSGRERGCSPVCLSSGPSLGLAGPSLALLTSCQRGHSAHLGVHSKQVLKQRGGHVWHHIQGPFGSCPTSSLPSWEPWGQARSVSDYGDSYSEQQVWPGDLGSNPSSITTC